MNICDLQEQLDNGCTSFFNSVINIDALQGTKVENASFNACVLVSEQEIVNVGFTNCLFIECTATNIEFKHCAFNDCKLRYCTFTSTALESCTFKSCSLRGNTFTQCKLLDVILAKGRLNDNVFNSSELNIIFSCAPSQTSGNVFKNLSSAAFYDEPENLYDQARIVPKDTAIIGWKKLRDNHICQLLIPKHALRSNATGRKCRASEALVLAIYDNLGQPCKEGRSMNEYGFMYNVAATVEPRSCFNENPWTECASGIHFFLTRAEAEAY